MATAPAPLNRHVPRKADEGVFYLVMGIFALFFSVAAFIPSVVHPANRLGPLTPLLAVHGTVMLAWLLFFILQTGLARARQVSLHRRLGLCSAILAAAVVIFGYEVTIALGRRGYDLAGDIAGARSDALAAMAFPLLDLFMFSGLFLAAILYRRDSAVHKRLMLLALTGALMPATVTHFFGHYAALRDRGFLTPAIIAVLLAAGPISDRLRLGRVHPVGLWTALGIFLLDNACAAFVVPSVFWHSFAERLIR